MSFESFHQSTQNYQRWNFDKALLSTVENAWALDLQWSYIFHDNEDWYKKWTSQNLTQTLEKSKNLFFFNWLLVTKVYIVWATKVQRSYLSWHWGVMKILKKDWPVVWKKTLEIWQNFTRALESVKIGTLIGS